MDEKEVKELLRDLVDSAGAVLNLINEKAMFGDDQESEQFMPVMNSMVFYNLEQAVFRALDSGVLEEGESDGDPRSMISDLCSYIWEEFKKAEDEMQYDKFYELGYYMGRYVAMKKIVESDEFKKLDALCEKEESNESV